MGLREALESLDNNGHWWRIEVRTSAEPLPTWEELGSGTTTGQLAATANAMTGQILREKLRVRVLDRRETELATIALDGKALAELAAETPATGSATTIVTVAWNGRFEFNTQDSSPGAMPATRLGSSRCKGSTTPLIGPIRRGRP